jgi:hypothetical protein
VPLPATLPDTSSSVPKLRSLAISPLKTTSTSPTVGVSFERSLIWLSSNPRANTFSSRIPTRLALLFVILLFEETTNDIVSSNSLSSNFTEYLSTLSTLSKTISSKKLLLLPSRTTACRQLCDCCLSQCTGFFRLCIRYSSVKRQKENPTSFVFPSSTIRKTRASLFDISREYGSLVRRVCREQLEREA